MSRINSPYSGNVLTVMLVLDQSVSGKLICLLSMLPATLAVPLACYCTVTAVSTADFAGCKHQIQVIADCEMSVGVLFNPSCRK
ncbi:hypothetical protein D3C81_1380190 [compost metagenome]